MSHKFLLISMLFLIIPLLSADKVGIVVSFPDGSIHGECLQTNSGTNGYELLQKMALPTLWAGPSSFGHMLCQINGVGQETDGNFCGFTGGKFWSFYILKDNKWKSLPVGSDGGERCWNGDVNLPEGDHYCVKDKDVIGFKFIEYGDPEPTIYSFNEICNPLKLKEVKVYVNGKKQSDVDETGGDIRAAPNSTILLKIEVENPYIFDELEIKDINAEITINNINYGKNIERKIKFKDLKINEEDEDKAFFTIPLVLEKDNYELELKITGKSSIGKQETIINYEIEIDRKKHDLILSKIELENLESCQNNSNKLTLEVINIGEKDEDVFLTIKNSDINLDFSDNFKLEESSNSIYKKEVGFKIPFVKPGDYEININLDYSQNTNEKATLTVKDCNQGKNFQIQTTSKSKIQMTGIKKAIPQQQTSYQKPFLELYAIPILLGVFLFFLIASLILVMIIINK